MNKSAQSITATALVLAFSAPAFSAVSNDVYTDVQSAAGHNSSVSVDVEGDVVTLTGFVENDHALQAIEHSAEMNGANVVINNVLQVS